MTAPESPQSVADEVAEHLLSIGAVTVSPRQPYTWSSGVRSPVYCDNRRIMSFPDVREAVAGAWSQLILTRCPDAQVIAGVATAGISHAAFLADRLRLPMVYVRSRGKDHGLGKTVEGVLPSGARVVVIEDLISTGGSILDAVRELRQAGAKVLAASAVFTYGLPAAAQALEAEKVPWFTLSDLDALKRAATRVGALSSEEIGLLDEGMASVAQQIAQRAATRA